MVTSASDQDGSRHVAVVGEARANDPHSWPGGAVPGAAFQQPGRAADQGREQHAIRFGQAEVALRGQRGASWSPSASAATASSSQNAVARSRWALGRELSRTGASAAEVSCGLWSTSRDLPGG
jgi:hypothetical protein